MLSGAVEANLTTSALLASRTRYFYQHVWEAERALKAAVPTAWLVKGGEAFAVVRFSVGGGNFRRGKRRIS